MDVGIALEIARTTLSLHLSDFEELKGKRDNALGVGDWERARACERQMKLLENDREGMKVDVGGFSLCWGRFFLPGGLMS